MSEMITLDTLTKAFGPLTAVDGVSLTVRQGEVLGFLGPNGAGKTTTMRMLAGFLEPSAGTATICGHDVVAASIAARRCLGYLPEGAPLYGDMTPAAFLGFVAAIRGLSGADRRRRIADVVAKVALEDVLDQPIETLSKGFKRRVGLAQAMLHDPAVLILDEPTDGLDPNQKHQVRELIRGMAHDKAIIISTHILEEVESVCTRAVIIARGRVVADGTAEDLLGRLPRHNAIHLTVAAAEAPRARALLTDVLGEGRVEDQPGDDGCVSFYVLAQDVRDQERGSLLAAVAKALHDAAITVETLTVERARLDEVFRSLTQDPGVMAAGPGHG